MFDFSKNCDMKVIVDYLLVFKLKENDNMMLI